MLYSSILLIAITLQDGRIPRISTQVSIPFLSGRLISSNTISVRLVARYRRTLSDVSNMAFSSTPSICCSIYEKPCNTTGWSSTTTTSIGRIFIGQWYFNIKHGSLAGTGDYFQGSTQHGDPALDIGQSQSFLPCFSPVKPHTVIFHGNIEPMVYIHALHQYPLGPGVLDGIGQQLLHNAVDRYR